MTTSTPTTDAQIIEGLRARDRDVWADLYAAYQPRLRAFAYRLSGSLHDADDLVQETFVRAVPRLDQLDPETADIAGYLFATLRNLFLKQVERAGKTQPVGDVPEPRRAMPATDEPEREAMVSRQQEEVRLANSRLEPRHRMVLALRELEDRSYAEIAEVVGMNENAVAQLLYRARASLRAEMRMAQIDPERLPVGCRRYLPLLAAHLDGQLGGARLTDTLAHLGSCDRCQDVLISMREASNRYRALILPAALLDIDEARADVERRLDDVSYWSAGARRRLLRTTRVLAVVVGAFGIFAVSSVAFGDARAPKRITSPSQTRPTAGQIVAATPVLSAVPSVVLAPTLVASASLNAARAVPQSLAAGSVSTPLAKPNAASPTASVAPAAAAAPTVTPAKSSLAPPASTPMVAAVATTTIPVAVKPPAPKVSVRLPAAPTVSAPALPTPPGVSTPTVPPPVVVLPPVVLPPVLPPPVIPPPDPPADTTAPVVTITSSPPASTTNPNASFTFAADDAAATFECALDGAAYAACVSPANYPALAIGAHSFAVRGRDGAGNIGTLATSSWTTTAPLPELYVLTLLKNSIVVANRGEAAAGPSVLTITLIGTFSVPALPPGGTATFTWSLCRIGTYTAVVDRADSVVESDESNNVASTVNSCP